MRRQKLHFDNLDAVLKSSPSAASKGTQQFETPPDVAEALCLPLPPVRPIVFDPQCGHGALLRAAALTCKDGSHRLMGLDIDPTASIPDFPSRWHCQRDVIHGDCTKILPLLLQAKARFDLIVCNPPFSLRWKIPGYWNTAMDSTRLTFEAMAAMLTKIGEGMMLCNAATADRLLVNHSLYAKVWLRLDVPNFFPGVLQKMKIAVLYFANSHKGSPGRTGGGPLTLTAPDAMPDTIRRQLEYASKNRDSLISGYTVRRASDTYPNAAGFEAVQEEWKRLTDAEFAARAGWNIRLNAHGEITTYLTPFQKLTGDVPAEVVKALSNIDGQHPTALVVQRNSRRALLIAVKGNIWRVHPEVLAAVDAAVLAYNAVRAPLRPLNRVQRLGHLDEEDMIKCSIAPCYGFTPGKSYPMESETIEGKKVESRKHWKRKDETEDVLVTGQELLIRIQDDNRKWHAFTQYSLGAAQESERPEDYFHLLSELVECFDIPEVPDVAELHPKEFATYQARMKALEWN